MAKEPRGTIPTEEVFRRVLEAYERGQTLEALRRAESFAPLPKWGGVSACVMGARIAANAGAPRLATLLSARALKTDPKHPEAIAQYGYEVYSRRGPLALWQALRNQPVENIGTAEQRAELLVLKGRALSHLRDFAAAERLLAEAEALDPARPWNRLQRSHLLESQDKIEEALAVAREAVAIYRHPYYRPGVQACAHLLQLLNRDEEAIEYLKAAGQVLQNGPIAAQLYALLSENNRWSEAEEALQHFQELSPLAEPPIKKWITAQKSRAAYHLDRREEAAALASALEGPFEKKFAENLRRPPPERERLQLEVTFVRQHFKTCAPATLAAIGRYWRLAAEHLQLAEAMCYDGTPHWQQRDWAEKNAWHVREFRVTEQTAIALIEKGVPFAISTVEATSAHMMALIGFDRTRGTLLLRDPGQPYVIEVLAEEFLKRYRAFGPHGMVFIPHSEQKLLEGIEFPDAELYDEHHLFWLALAKHQREEAERIQRRMQERFPDAALTLETRLELAFYDANQSEQLRCLEKLLELFPNNPARLLRKLGCLSAAPWQERRQFLESACAAPQADPALFVALARSLSGDARFLPAARFWARRALLARPMDSSAISAMADLVWDQDQQQATELYWFAATLEGFRESLYHPWFIACRRTGKTNEALAHLQDRFARFGTRSEQPGLTLAWAWREMDQPSQARAVLQEAIQRRPDDGYQWLRAASLMATLSEPAEAENLLNNARGKVRENDWLRTAAEIAENRFDFDQASECYRQLLLREPLAVDGHTGVARAMARREGMQCALAHLEKASSEFPHHYGLQRLLVEWSQEAGPQKVEAAARNLLQLEPGDAWARREITMALSRMGRPEEALQEAIEAARIEPSNSYCHSILGHLHRQLGQRSQAREKYRQAVDLSVDNGDAVSALLEMSRTDAERKEELAFVEQNLVRQVVSGEGLLAFLELARPILEPGVLLRSLRHAHQARPDLWHAWSALVSQLGHMGELDEALLLARKATERFGHLSRTWIDLATVHQWKRQPEEEIAAAQRAFELNPSAGQTTLVLAGALERKGKLEEARQVYERALRLSPRDPQLHALQAHLLWRQLEVEPALLAIERALRLAPGYDWAWNLFQDWAPRSGQPDRPANFSRSLTRERPGEMRVWLTFARILVDPALLSERLAAIDRAIELNPQAIEVWDLKAEILTGAEKFEEALRTCAEGIKACQSELHILRGRQAWVEAQRRRVPEAIRLMQELLAENASYIWGWHQLAAWLSQQERLPEATAAMEQLQRLRPHDPWVNRQLGFLKLRQKDTAGASSAFTAALLSSPTDTDAARSLFDLEIETGDLNRASATLEVMKLHQPGSTTMAAEIILLLKRGNRAGALKVLETLCASPDPDPWPLDAAVNSLQSPSQANPVLKVLKRSLASGKGHPQAAAAAVRLLLGRGSSLGATWLFLRLPPGEMQRRAAAPLIQGLTERKKELLFRWVLWRRREVLFADTECWGQVGYGMVTFNWMARSVRWLSDWPSRNEAQPWMLFNLCLALRHQGQYTQAHDLARQVLQTWGHRQGSEDLHLFLAIEEGLSGDIGKASEHLALSQVRAEVQHDLQLQALARGLIDFLKVPEAERTGRFKQIRQDLGEHFGAWKLLNSMRDVRRTFGRAGKLFQARGGGWQAGWWFRWKLHWQWLLLPLLPFAVLIALQPPVLLGLLIARYYHRRKG